MGASVTILADNVLKFNDVEPIALNVDVVAPRRLRS